MTLLSICLIGIVIPLVARREFNVLRTFQCLPISRYEYMTAFVSSLLILSALFSVLFLGSVSAIYHLNFSMRPPAVLQMLGLVAIAAIAFALMGIAIAGRLRSVAAASAAANAVFFPLVLMGNLTIPIQGFPAVVQNILGYSPSAIASSSLRDIVVSGHSLFLGW